VALVRPKARDDLTVVELDGEAVIYDEETSDLHQLNQTATIVFGLCDGTNTMKEMAVDISEVFGVPIEDVEPQIRGLIREFRKVRLLVPGGPHYVPDRTKGTREAP